MTAVSPKNGLSRTRVVRVYDRAEGGSLTLRGTVRYKERDVESIAWDGPDLILATESGLLCSDREGARISVGDAGWKRIAHRNLRIQNPFTATCGRLPTSTKSGSTLCGSRIHA